MELTPDVLQVGGQLANVAQFAAKTPKTHRNAPEGRRGERFKKRRKAATLKRAAKPWRSRLSFVLSRKLRLS
jgi:hypothetical protein